MRRGEYSSKHGVLVVSLLFLLGASLLLSVPVTTNASPITQTNETTMNSMSVSMLREYSERDWDFASSESQHSFQLLRKNVGVSYDVPELASGIVLDVIPFGTPHAPIYIDDNTDFETQGWDGEGTVEQPYIIAGLNINSTSTGGAAINITDTDVHFFIKDCWLTSNETTVVELNSVSHGRIMNNTILQSDRGIVALHSDDLTIYDNLFYSFGWAGVYIEDCTLSTLANNNCTVCFVGLHVEQSNNILVEDNYCIGCLGGIELYFECEEVTVFNNTAVNNEVGIGLYLNCENNLIDSNNCTRNLFSGIYSENCLDNDILKNLGLHNGVDILLQNCTSHTISDNDCRSTTWSSRSISLQNSNNSIISNNHVLNTYICIEAASGSSHNEITSNNCSYYGGGVVVWQGAPHNTITNNTCDSGWWGEADIFVEDSSYCMVTENRCNRSMFNIASFDSNHTTVVDNVCYESTHAGIGFDGNYHTLAEGNILGNGSTGIVALSQVYATIKDNTISNFTGTYSPLTGIHLENIHNSSIEGNHITECNVALWMSQSRDCNIADNVCVDNIDGIILVATNYDIIIENNNCHLQQGYAIVVVESFNCSVVRNTCTNTSGFEGICLLLGDADVDVSWNSFSLSTGGMDVQGNDGLITHNTIEDNDLFGISIGGIIGPNVTWNVFEDNGVNAVDSSSTAMFDYNYWSNYTGVDANADGIGDTWHPIDGSANNNDPHPIVYHPTLPVWSSEPVDQVSELGHAFQYLLDVTTSTPLAPIVDWWVSNPTHFVVNEGTVENAIFLDLGEYPLEVKAINLYGFELSATFTVTVSDTVDPAIIGPDNFDYLVGQVGRLITWIPEDYDPASYSVTLDGVVVMSGDWNSTTQNYTISADGLTVGIHIFVVTFTDGSDNTASHTVVVTVRGDSMPLFIAIGVGGATIALLVVVYLVRKKGTGD